MKKIVYFMAALPLLVACNNKDANEVATPLTPFEKGEELSITSQPLNDYERPKARYVHVREEVASTEVCVGDEQIVTSLLWDAGDQIDVFVDDNSATHPSGEYPQSVFTLISGANTSEGTFHGTMPADGTEYAIMYPHRSGTIVEDYTEGQQFPYQVTQFSMPLVQTYRSPAGNTDETKEWPTFASGLLPIFGKGDLTNGFVTYPCGGALRFKLWSDKTGGEIVRTIRLAARNNEDLSGSFEIHPTVSGSVVMEMVPKVKGSGLHSIILRMPTDFTMPTTQETAVWIYFVLPAPLTFDKGFGVYTYDKDTDDPDIVEAEATHIFLTPESANEKIKIKQNHITTIVFGEGEDKGNYGNINGSGWKAKGS